MIAKILKVVAAVVAVGGAGYFALPYLVCMDVPKYKKLADCNTNALAFALTCDGSPSGFVLGLRPPYGKPPVFRGEITIIQQSTRTVARIQIDSDHSTPFSWLAGAGLEGHVLGWSPTNGGERLGTLLRCGQSYDVQVAFTEGPPAGSSLWLASIGRAKWP